MSTRVKAIFSTYSAIPGGVASQVTYLLEDETVLIYRPVTITNNKVVYGWAKMPKVPDDLSKIPFLGDI